MTEVRDVEGFFTGFPAVAQLNHSRHAFFKRSHSQADTTSGDRVVNWMAHKVLSLASVPANIGGIAVGAITFTACASTLGALKVAIFAATLGNVKPTFSTGCLWFGERTLHSVTHLLFNAGELLHDAGQALYQGARAVRWVGRKLHLEQVVEAIFQQIGRAFDFIGRRLQMGCQRAISDEPTGLSGDATPLPIRAVNDVTKKHRIDWQSGERPLVNIAAHTALSAVNIPVNVMAAAMGAVASTALATAFVAKVVLHAATGAHVPVPTYTGHAIQGTFAAASNAVLDAATDVGDGFVMIFKASRALGLNKVVTTALKVLGYIPEAVFS
ncbi:hypothetical protein SCG7086_DJ_00020 [Chlamydiales bacterium SCGC AG-110-P3]|nr:hypothetical protein SCG7086_DJ_00020 [Chlamydiales bacterium SCGC AG-110-P3]